jgi:hypothetical protein
MNFLVMQCHACVDVFLSEARSVRDGACQCPECDAPAVVFGSNSYNGGDVMHFDDLRRAVRSAKLSAAHAATLLARLKSVVHDEGAVRDELRQVAGLLPSVTLVRAAAAAETVPPQHVAGMLLVILAAVVSACGREAPSPA